MQGTAIDCDPLTASASCHTSPAASGFAFDTIGAASKMQSKPAFDPEALTERLRAIGCFDRQSRERTGARPRALKIALAAALISRRGWVAPRAV